MSHEIESELLGVAQQTLEKAEAVRKEARENFAAAEYERGQIEHSKREMQELEKIISRREAKLKELGEDEFLERERVAEDKLQQAQKLMQAYDRDKHAAALALQSIDAREKRDRSAA